MTRSLADLVSRAAATVPDKAALLHGDRTVTYAELEDRVRRTAAALAGLGVRKGDRVALMVGNSPEFVEALHGTLRLGAVAAPLNTMLTSEEATHVFADADAKVIVTDPAFLPTVLASRDGVAVLEHILVTGSGRSSRKTESFERAVAKAGDPPEVEVGEDDLAVLAYTAGTTASPKGAMLTHGNLLANLDQISAVPALAEARSDVVLLVLPLFHIYALNVVLGITIREEATAVLVDRFEPRATLDLVERHKITVLFGAPPMFVAWLGEPGDHDLSSVRIAVSGAAPLPGEVLQGFRERFGITIWEGYGLTETAPAVTTNALAQEARADSIGLVLPGVDVRLVDESGQDVEEGDPGEIVIRGPNVFSGYWQKPEESKEAFRDGWFRTGDVAYRDEDEYLHIVDRTKDLIIVSGFNVFPKEVEDAIATHPDVAECVVIGVPDQRTGEAVKALVAPRPGTRPTEEEIIDHCRTRLARFKLPHHVELVEHLPRHVTGKVLRRELRGRGEQADA